MAQFNLGESALNSSGLRNIVGNRRFRGNTTGWELWPTKTQTRGKIICEDLEKTVEFQFNPTTLKIKKDQIYYNRKFSGRMNVEPIWTSGGVREISFKLIFDATAGSAYKKIGLYNKVLGTFNSNTSLSASRDPREEENDAVASNNRGTLDVVEDLESFTYPALSDTRGLRFTDGVAIFDSKSVFLPPPTVVFVFGEFYMEAKMTMQYSHILFNPNLIPVRTEMDVRLNVLEGVLSSKNT